MKRIILSLAMIALVGFLAAGATAAWFTHQDVEVGNTFAAGQLVFDIRSHGTFTAGVPISVTNAAPGIANAHEAMFEVYNHSNSIVMKYRLYTSKTGGDNYLYNKLKYQLYKCDYPINPPDYCTTWVYRKGGWLKDLTSANYAVPHDNNVGPNGTHRWKMKLWLDESAGNYYQNKSVTFDIVGDATQPENPGWTE